MTDPFCPSCGTGRVGALRFCRTCGFDFDSLPAATVIDALPESVVQTTQPSEAGAAPSSTRRGWVILGAVIFLAVVAAAGFIGLSNSGAFLPKHAVTGTFTLTDASDTFVSQCSGSGGYSDISFGTNVVLKDGDGKLLSTTSLGFGEGSGSRCEFPFTLADVPEVPFYTIEVGRRGDLSYSLADMNAMDWELALTLGS